MAFIAQLRTLIDELANIPSKDVELKMFIEKCQSLFSKYLPSDSVSLRQLKNITTEPQGAYFPEMYSKMKEQSLLDCKNSLGDFLKNAADEFNRLITEKPFEEIIEFEESQYLEFKSTLCWDIKNSKVDKKMEEIIMKSISALSNSEGGVLLIGINDDKQVLGLENDYRTFKNGSGNRDGFELYLTTLIINNFSKTFAKDNLTIEFPKFGDKEICLIRIKKSVSPFTIKISDKSGQAKEKFFIRVNNSSRDIDDLLEFARYIKQRFPKWQ